MADAREWTTGEFAIVLENPRVPAEDLADRLDRTKADIGNARAAIHGFHRGGDTSMLTQVMLHILQAQPGRVICAVCSTNF